MTEGLFRALPDPEVRKRRHEALRHASGRRRFGAKSVSFSGRNSPRLARRNSQRLWRNDSEKLSPALTARCGGNRYEKGLTRFQKSGQG